MNTPVVGQDMPETTGRYIVTFKEGTKTEAMNSLKKDAGVAKANIMMSSDFQGDGIDVAQVPENGGVFFENLGIAVMNIDPAASGAMAAAAGADSIILAVEPEGVMYAVSDVGGASAEYLRGFRDAANAIGQGSSAIDSAHSFPQHPGFATAFSDTKALSWGLQATRAAASRFSGQGRKVAVLDTGLDLKHPDFAGRAITSKSFIAGVDSVQDGHGHGTHCVGTACGPKAPPGGPRYGVAWGAQIFVGKVLSDGGSGGDISILAGIDWAVANKCEAISMSLSSAVPTTSIAYETAGQRALDSGCLIIAAAGNNAQRSSGAFAFVTRPANSRSMMAVGALDSALKMADFSDRDTALSAGTAVDIGGPGVMVYSTWPMPQRYNLISGTSMATPHVAGIAALWSEATGATGASLWQRLVVNARALPLAVVDVGRGLVQAP